MEDYDNICKLFIETISEVQEVRVHTVKHIKLSERNEILMNYRMNEYSLMAKESSDSKR